MRSYKPRAIPCTNGQSDVDSFMQLNRLPHLPIELTSITPKEIKRVFPTPTLITIDGRHPEPLFLSILLHGNETTGFYVLQDLARRFAGMPPPRSLMIFVGNVEATAAGLRRLDYQEDFNRIWAGGHGTPFDLARAVIDAAREAHPLASIDIHNNTGTNPFYGCINTLQSTNLQLAALFSRIAVYYRNPPTTQSMAFSQFCPAVTVECGRVGNAAGTERAIEFVNAVLHLDRLPDRMPHPSDLLLFETVGRVIVDENCSFSFEDDGADLILRSDLEQKNFCGMAIGEEWGRSRYAQLPLTVLDEGGIDLTASFFIRHDDSIRLRTPVTPAMITRDRTIIRQDCLGYLMAPLTLAT